MRGIDAEQVSGRAVLLRADLNVPLDGTRITDDGRIRASLPTISKLAGRGARVIVLAHLGRPSGADFAERAAGGPSLEPVAVRLARLLGRPVSFAADVAGPSAVAVAAELADGDVALLENVRFEPAETSKDDDQRAALARRLVAVGTRALGQAAAGPLYVGDGFGAVHRKHASVYDLPRLLPHVAGDLVLSEVEVLRRLTRAPAATVRAGARRRQAVRQAGRDRQPARPGGPAADRRGHVVHVPLPRKVRGRQVTARSRPDRTCGG